MAINLHLSHFRFGIDSGTESTHGWLANEDTNISIAPDTTFLLRLTEQETGGTACNNLAAQLQCRKNAGAWQNVTTTSAIVKAVVAAAFADGAPCTKRLSGTGTFESSGAGCSEDGTSGGNANDIAANGNSETEFAVQIVGADVAAGDTIEFRITVSGGTASITYDVVPTATVNVPLTANLSGTLAGCVVAAAATLAIAGALAAILADTTIGATASAPAAASLSETLNDTTLESAATAAGTGRTADLAASLGDTTANAVVAAEARCELSAPLGNTTPASTASAEAQAALSGNLVGTEPSAAASAQVVASVASALDGAGLSAAVAAQDAASVAAGLEDTVLVATASGGDSRTADSNIHLIDTMIGAVVVAPVVADLISNLSGSVGGTIVIYPVDEVYKIPGMKRKYGIAEAPASPLFRVYRVPKMKRIYGGH